MQILFTVLALLNGSLSEAAVCSRTLTFSDGSVLTAAQLNDEFNTAINCVNSIDNANISTNANILPVKLSSTIAGDGIGRDGNTGVLEVNVDGTSIEIDSDVLQIPDLGISTAKIASSAVTTAKIADSNVTTAKIADLNVTTGKIADGAITAAKKSSLNTSTSSEVSSITTSSGSFVDVTGLTLNLTTNGRPVMIALVSAPGTGFAFTTGVTGTGNEIYFKVLRGATSISETRAPNGIGAHFITVIDSPSAGTYTYKLQWRVAVAGTATLLGAKLVAYEL